MRVLGAHLEMFTRLFMAFALVVGLAGLLGSGRTEAAQLIFGIVGSETGEIIVNGRRVRLNSPRHAVNQGFALCPEDRKVEGIVGELTVRENIILALQAKRGWFRHIAHKKQLEIADEMIKALHIVTPDANKPAGQLSGGNQQKVVLSRWIYSDPEVLFLDEPTRGIDVGAKFEIYQIMNELVSQGKSIVMISSEMPELLGMCDRVYVMNEGRIIGEFNRYDATQENIMRCIMRDAGKDKSYGQIR